MTAYDEAALDRLVHRERYLRDTFQWEAMRPLWLEDTASTHINISWVRHGTIQDFIERSAALQKRHATTSQAAFHQLQPLDIRVKGQRAFVITMNHVMIRGKHSSGVDFDMDSWGHQLQTFVKVGEEWKFRSFEQIYLKDSVTPAYPQPAEKIARMEAEFAQFAGRRSSIRCLAWLMAEVGEEVLADTPGYDEESTWKPVMGKHERWLETGEGW